MDEQSGESKEEVIDEEIDESEIEELVPEWGWRRHKVLSQWLFVATDTLIDCSFDSGHDGPYKKEEFMSLDTFSMADVADMIETLCTA